MLYTGEVLIDGSQYVVLWVGKARLSWNAVYRRSFNRWESVRCFVGWKGSTGFISDIFC